MSGQIGNSKTVYVMHGASNHSEKEREENDYYATDPRALEMLLNEHLGRLRDKIWEPAAGGGHLVEVLKKKGYNVIASDLVKRDYPLDFQANFLQMNEIPDGVNTIISNPPYRHATEFVLKSLELLPDNGTLIMFLKTTFLEGKKRWEQLYSKWLPVYIYQFVNRVDCIRNGNFEEHVPEKAISFAWFLWIKGAYITAPRIYWLTGKIN